MASTGEPADPNRPIRLGPFVLQEPVGRGGMGAVWRGWHHDRSVPVAVKVLDAEVNEQDRAFDNEVKAVARLDHPGVVWVYDVGKVDRQAAEASQGRLAIRRPYIAMEFASRGTLRDLGRLPWEGVREVLLALLDALAHAHARGVIHRDLKPANVLFCGPEDLRPGLKLADFGIAHAMERMEQTTGHKTAIGTVQYMAPEQIRSESHDTGPWTDLYALGNVAWQLLTGRIPFSQYSGVALVRAQLDEPLPALPTGVAPAAFQEWLSICVAKDPTQRFLRAADAAAALIAMPATQHGAVKGSGVPVERLPTVQVDVSEDGLVTSPVTGTRHPDTGLPEGVPLNTGIVALPMHRATRGGGEASDPTGRARLPFGDWRRPEAARRSLQLFGAGLGLYKVRRQPMVGRIEERDALWGALRQVAEEGRPRAVVITGPAGSGKSEMLRWLGERAHELGVAIPVHARFKVDDEADAPIYKMWRNYLRVSEVETGARARWLLKALTRLGLGAEPEAFAVLVGQGSSEARRRRSVDLIRALTSERPVIVALDDVQFGIEGLELARMLLAAPLPLPVLVVVSATAEALVGHRRERELVEEISQDEVTLKLGPLPERDHAALVEEVLGLSPALAAQVAERTGGNPAFAVHVIGDWVRRGVLVLGPVGFEVRPGEKAELPVSMLAAWSDRIQRTLHGLPDKAALSLERAAVLGLAVNEHDWQRSIDDPDGTWAEQGRARRVPDNDRLRTEIVARLVEARLAEATATGFTFTHGLVREAVLERARAAHRLVEHHRACAIVLRHAEDAEAAAERIGRHLLEAGALEAAIEPLLQGVIFRRDTAGARSALALLATAEDALRRLRLADADPRWGESGQLRALLSAELGEIAEAERIASKVVASEALPGWLPHALDARLTVARIRASHGDLVVADRELAQIVSRSGDPVQQGLATAERALVAARLGDRDQARALTDAAIRLLRRAASSRALAECWRVVGTTALLSGNDRQSEDALSRALRLYQRRGNIVGQAECLAGLGRLAITKDLGLAEERLTQSILLYEVAGISDVVRPRADLARVRLGEERYEPARDLLGHVRLALGRQGRARAVEGLGALQLAAAAGVGDWEDFDHRLRQIEGDPVLELGDWGRWSMALAADLAEASGQVDRASRVRITLESVPSTAGRPRTGSS